MDELERLICHYYFSGYLVPKIVNAVMIAFGCSKECAERYISSTIQKKVKVSEVL